MNREEIENIKRHLGMALYNHTRNFYDYDMQVDCNITYNQLKLLGEYINQLETNIDEAIKLIKNASHNNEFYKEQHYYLNPEEVNAIYEQVLEKLERGRK